MVRARLLKFTQGSRHHAWASLGGSTRCISTTPSLTADKILPADSYISSRPDVPVKLRITKDAPGNAEPILVQTAFKNTLEKFPNQKAMSVKRDGNWLKWNFTQYYEDVNTVAKAFLALGLSRFAGVGIMGPNTPEWAMSSLGAVFAGGLSAGIYATNSPDMVTYISNKSPLEIFVVHNWALLQRILDGRSFQEAMPTVKKVIMINGEPETHTDMIITWAEFMKLGQAQSDELLAQSEKDQAVNQSCLLMYTSGTTGPPKGTMLSHDNITWASYIGPPSSSWGTAREEFISYLPLSHIAGTMLDIYMPICYANYVGYADEEALRGTLVQNLQEIRPNQFIGVPRVWEKLRERLEDAFAKASPTKKALLNWARAAATEHHTGIRSGAITKPGLKYNLAHKLVLSKLHTSLGLDKCTSGNNQCFTGAAPLSRETHEFFESLAIVLNDIYGSTECTGPQTVNRPGTGKKLDTVGYSYWGVSNDIYKPDSEGIGEIITNGRAIFMGYIGEEEKTKSSFTEDYWYKSGDMGKIDTDGYLTIQGRTKELIITSGGENIPPVLIEDNIKKILGDVVSQVLVVGEGKKHLASLITLKAEVDPVTMQPTTQLMHSAVQWAKRKGCTTPPKTVDDFLNGPHKDLLDKAIMDGINEANELAISNAQRVQKFRILPIDLSISGGELGPTLKTKRFFIYKKYEDYIKSMYQD